MMRSMLKEAKKDETNWRVKGEVTGNDGMGLERSIAMIDTDV
jgi:hypothetical protein